MQQFSIAHKAICESCDGTGARSEKDIVDCPVCDGRGIRLVRHQLGPGIFQQVQMHCDACGGRGRKIKHVCSECKGHRIVQTTSELILHIDRGMPEGAEVLFEGEADESPDLPAGDVIVRIRSRRKGGGFVRKESNLYWQETLTVAEVSLFLSSICSCVLTSTTLTGSPRLQADGHGSRRPRNCALTLGRHSTRFVRVFDLSLDLLTDLPRPS